MGYKLTLAEAAGMIQDMLDWYSDHDQAQEDTKTYLIDCGWEKSVIEDMFENGIDIE